MEPEILTANDVYERFGRASETAQHYEYGLATVWLYLEYFSKGWWQKSPSPENLSLLLNAMDKKTLGHLLKKVQGLSWFECEGACAHFDDDLVEALEARNFLMHEFFKNSNGATASHGARQNQLLELERCLEALDKGMTIVSRLLNALVKLNADVRHPHVIPGKSGKSGET